MSWSTIRQATDRDLRRELQEQQSNLLDLRDAKRQAAPNVSLRFKEGSLSPAYIYALRKGQRDNPTKRHLELLASFFGVTPAYFFDEEAARRIEQQLDLLAAFRDGEVRRLAARASGLSPASLTGILKMVDAARAIEGLPAEDAGEERPGQPGSASRPQTGESAHSEGETGPG